jgi:single-strand DNA-binding protein
MPNFNKVILIGNLTRDPTIRSFSDDRQVANFGLAINRSYRTSDGQQREETCFIDCDAWGRTASVIGQYLSKGSSCLIEGRLRLDNWEDQQGQKRSRHKISVDNVQLLGRSGPDQDGPVEQESGGFRQPQPSSRGPHRRSHAQQPAAGHDDELYLPRDDGEQPPF